MAPHCLFVLALLVRGAHSCTTLVAGRKTTRDGSVLVTHSDDGESKADARVCRVEAKNHTEGSRRNVYWWGTGDYPRYVGYERCDMYKPRAGQEPMKPIGSIPQVPHTYAYYDGPSNPLVNEHGVSIGESTCSGMFGANASGHGGKALLSFDELGRLAMERARTARSAVMLMGSFAEQYGFYGTDSDEGSAESLIVADPDEAYIFHILPDPSGQSAIWAAQRVPDDHVSTVANMFVIRQINFTDETNFLFSESVRTVARGRGWWQDGSPFDFTRIYSAGEYEQKFYSGRRVWEVYRRFGLHFPDSYTNLRYDVVYPTTARPSKFGITVHELFAIHRDHYEGTKYDMTKGLAAGPFGSPDRWTTTSSLKGSWERQIGIFRATSTLVVQTRRSGQGAVLWFGPHAAAASCFMPITTQILVPDPYMNQDPDELDRASAYWAHKYVFNIAQLRYNDSMHDVRELQQQLEIEGEQLVDRLDSECGSICPPSKLNAAYNAHAKRILELFWALPDQMIAKYADGFLSDGRPLGYPDWWLKAVGYEQGPPPPPKQEADMHCDTRAKACIDVCPASGFASCASRCLSQNCGKVEKQYVQLLL